MEFIAYAITLRSQINEFLDQTGLNLPLNKSKKFFYQHHTAIETDISTSNIRHLHRTRQAPKSEDVLKIIHAIRKYNSRLRISSLEEFDEIVAKWTAIPPNFAGVCWNAEMTSRDDLIRWISDRLKGMSMELAAAELAEWIVGLLSHPEFCRQDALAAELEEFFETQTAEFILSLWQFIILKVAKQFVFYPLANENRTSRENGSTNVDQSAYSNVASSEKQARKPYGGKSGKSDAVAAVRDIIATQMSEMNECGGWRVAQIPQPIFHDRDKETDRSMTAHWRHLGSLLDARDYSKHKEREHRARSRSQRSRSKTIIKKQKSRSRLRSRSRSRSRRRERYKC